MWRRRNNRRFVGNFTKFSEKVKDNVLNNSSVIWNVFDDFISTSLHQNIMEKDSLEGSGIGKSEKTDEKVGSMTQNAIMVQSFMPNSGL